MSLQISRDDPSRAQGATEPAGTVLADRPLRIGTWNLDARHQSTVVDFLLGLDCDVWLLTEVSPRLELPGYSKAVTGGVMARGQHWAGVFSRRPLEPLPEPHPASATARIGGQVFCSSILPWRGCGTGDPWGSGTHAEKTGRCLDRLRESLHPDWVWGGDWNHSLLGPEWAGSLAGRRAVLALLEERGLQVPTAELPHPLGELRSIDHIAVPGGWQVVSAEQVGAVRNERRLSDHDAYVIEIMPGAQA